MSLIRYEYCCCELNPEKQGCVPLDKKEECKGRATCLRCPHYKYRKERKRRNDNVDNH